jgi:hypothetical protein
LKRKKIKKDEKKCKIAKEKRKSKGRTKQN